MDKDVIIEQLQRQIAVLIAENKRLTSRIIELENNQKKNSSNSSKPPSSDIGRVHGTQSLREKSGKKPGGQDGHSGETLSFSQYPDEVVLYAVDCCGNCKEDIGDYPVADYDRRQVYDIPPIKVRVVEHRGQVKVCPRCGVINHAVFPGGVSQPVQYGPEIQKLSVYFTQYQLLPYGRTGEIFNDLFGHSLSWGFLVNNNHRFAGVLQPFLDVLKETLGREPVLGADETGFYYEGKRGWCHTLTTDKHTFYQVHEKRGREAMDDIGVLPSFQGVLVHDFWKSYNEFECGHGLCNVHHLRDLTFCHDVEKSTWAAAMITFLLGAHEKVLQAKELGKDRLSWWHRGRISKQFDSLMEQGNKCHPPPEKEKGKRGATKKTKTRNMIERFIDHKKQVLAFVTNFLVPFGNNLAEQALRMMKVKQKISGCFRSVQGARDFADTRSYIATAKKHGIPIMHALHLAIQGNPCQVLA